MTPCTTREIAERLTDRGAFLADKTVCLDTQGEGRIYLDGPHRKVLLDHEGPADATVRIPLRELAALVDGRIDTTVSYLLGKFRIEGELPLLFRLQEIFTQARAAA